MVFDTFCILFTVDALSPCHVSRCSHGFDIFLDYSVSAAVGRFAHSLFNQSSLSQKSPSETFKIFWFGDVLNRLSGLLGHRRSLGAAIPLVLKN